MKDDIVYLVFRNYKDVHPADVNPSTLAEYPDLEVNYRGYTNSLHTLKGFLTQRDERKYTIREYPIALIRDESSVVPPTMLEDLYKIKVYKFYTKKSDKPIPFFMSEYEFLDSKASIRYMLDDECALQQMNMDLERAVDIYLALKLKYKDALSTIGFIPREPDSFYDVPIDYSDEVTDYKIDPEIEPMVLSLESMIKVIKDDL